MPLPPDLWILNVPGSITWSGDKTVSLGQYPSWTLGAGQALSQETHFWWGSVIRSGRNEMLLLASAADLHALAKHEKFRRLASQASLFWWQRQSFPPKNFCLENKPKNLTYKCVWGPQIDFSLAADRSCWYHKTSDLRSRSGNLFWCQIRSGADHFCSLFTYRKKIKIRSGF